MQRLPFHSFNKCLLRAYSVPSSVLTADAAVVPKPGRSLSCGVRLPVVERNAQDSVKIHGQLIRDLGSSWILGFPYRGAEAHGGEWRLRSSVE